MVKKKLRKTKKTLSYDLNNSLKLLFRPWRLSKTNWPIYSYHESLNLMT